MLCPSIAARYLGRRRHHARSCRWHLRSDVLRRPLCDPVPPPVAGYFSALGATSSESFWTQHQYLAPSARPVPGSTNFLALASSPFWTNRPASAIDDRVCDPGGSCDNRARHHHGHAETMRAEHTKCGSGDLQSVSALRKDRTRIPIEFSIPVRGCEQRGQGRGRHHSGRHQAIRGDKVAAEAGRGSRWQCARLTHYAPGAAVACQSAALSIGRSKKECKGDSILRSEKKYSRKTCVCRLPLRTHLAHGSPSRSRSI